MQHQARIELEPFGMVGGERSHHYTIPASQASYLVVIIKNCSEQILIF